MASGKARYSGHDYTKRLPNLRLLNTDRTHLIEQVQPDGSVRAVTRVDESKLTDQLLEILKSHGVTETGEFLGYLVAEARKLNDRVIENKLHLAGKDIRQECSNLEKQLGETVQKLRTISDDLDMLLGMGVNPLNVADGVEAMLQQVHKVDLADYKMIDETEFISKDFALCIARLFEQFKLPTVANRRDNQSDSLIVKVLQALSNSAGVYLGDRTWVNKLIE
jgi:hypothetical protein